MRVGEPFASPLIHAIRSVGFVLALMLPSAGHTLSH
jgi:hypothetical protein